MSFHILKSPQAPSSWWNGEVAWRLEFNTLLKWLWIILLIEPMKAFKFITHTQTERERERHPCNEWNLCFIKYFQYHIIFTSLNIMLQAYNIFFSLVSCWGGWGAFVVSKLNAVYGEVEEQKVILIANIMLVNFMVMS